MDGRSARADREAVAVVEQLTFRVEPADLDEFVRRDAEVWTRYLEECDGFVRKEVWVPADEHDRVVIQIWWRSRDAWEAVGAAMVARLDAEMGRWFRPAECRAYTVIRPTPAAPPPAGCRGG